MEGYRKELGKAKRYDAINEACDEETHEEEATLERLMREMTTLTEDEKEALGAKMRAAGF
jgi:hypothetical protein